jgi:hypothetical protein
MICVRWPVSRVLSSGEGEMAIPLGRLSRAASRDRPGRLPGNGLRAVPIWSCSRWGLPCRSRYRSRGALLPHLFTLTFWPKPSGGLFSVALSLGSPPPDVIRHRVSVEPGLSSRDRNLQRPSGHLTRGQCRGLRRGGQAPLHSSWAGATRPSTSLSRSEGSASCRTGSASVREATTLLRPPTRAKMDGSLKGCHDVTGQVPRAAPPKSLRIRHRKFRRAARDGNGAGKR